MKLEEVLHKPTPPPNDLRWHIELQGHPEELLDLLSIIAHDEHDVIQTAEWITDDQLLICLKWIDNIIPRFILTDALDISNNIKIKHNGRTQCHGHNLSA